MRYYICILLLLLANKTALSASFDERFEPLGLNYAIAQWTDEDDWAIEVNYAFKYTLFNCEDWVDAPLIGCKKDDDIRFNFYFKYIGEFDFYAGTRDSGPVINRTSNPAFHFLFKLKGRKYVDWFDIGIEHRSNGQVTDADDIDTNPTSPTFGLHQTEIEDQNNNHEYFDTISRSADYLSISLGGSFGKNLNYSVSGKIYNSSTEESNITWGKLAEKGVKFKDYDLLSLSINKKFMLTNTHIQHIILGAEYTIGLEAFNADSLDVNLIIPWQSSSGWEIPLLVRAHIGPMDRLSNYAKEINSIGIGLVFTY